MDLGRLGVWYAADALDPEGWKRFIAATEQLGYSALWYSESRGFESMALASFLLCQSSTIVVGSSIASIYARDAVASRQGLRTLSAISGNRFVLGLGVSHAPAVEGFRGHAYGKPLTSMRQYLEQMREGEQDADTWPLALAALGPKMLALSAELTRGALPYNTTPEHTARAKDIVGPDKWLAVQQKVCLETSASKARELARGALARHLTLTNYRNSWRSQGFSETDLSGGGSDRFLDAMVAWGGEEAIARRVAEHFDAGASHVCIEPVHPGGLDEALRVLESQAPAA